MRVIKTIFTSTKHMFLLILLSIHSHFSFANDEVGNCTRINNPNGNGLLCAQPNTNCVCTKYGVGRCENITYDDNGETDCFCLSGKKSDTTRPGVCHGGRDWHAMKVSGKVGPKSSAKFEFRAGIDNVFEFFDSNNVDSEGKVLKSQKLLNDAITGTFEITFGDAQDNTEIPAFVTDLSLEVVPFDFLGESTGTSIVSLIQGSSNIQGTYNVTNGVIKFDEKVPCLVTNKIFPNGKELFARPILTPTNNVDEYKVTMTSSIILNEEACFISLDSFNANIEGKEVLIEWHTGIEIDNAGFRLWRAMKEEKDSHYKNITTLEELVPNKKFVLGEDSCAEGKLITVDFDKLGKLITTLGNSRRGSCYSFIDTSEKKPCTTYHYLLEDVDVSGHRTFHWDKLASVTTNGCEKKN